MSTWFMRFFGLIIVCLYIAHAYPSSMSKHKWLQERLGHHPPAAYETLPDSIDNDPYESDGNPPWLLFRSRKFCCAPPL